MELTKQTIDQLRRELSNELHEEWGDQSDAIWDALTSFDRACLTVVMGGAGVAPAKKKPVAMGGPKAGSPEARERARKAQETRKANIAKRANAGTTLTTEETVAQ